MRPAEAHMNGRRRARTYPLHLAEDWITTHFRTSSARPPHSRPKVGSEPIDRSPGLARRARELKKEAPMLRKVAAALPAATVFPAPVLAQGTQIASPPAKTGAVGPAATA